LYAYFIGLYKFNDTIQRGEEVMLIANKKNIIFN